VYFVRQRKLSVSVRFRAPFADKRGVPKDKPEEKKELLKQKY
jgi:hypothetical protein